MTLERQIQDWFEQLTDVGKRGFGGPDLRSVLRYDDSPLSKEMKAKVDQYHPLDPSLPPSVADACRVLESLKEPEFWCADRNISQSPGEILRPDLVLEDSGSSAFIIVEIKRSRAAAREFATEMLAYARCLREQHPGSQVFFILVSTSWAPLERRAFAKLAQLNIPVLALEYREKALGESNPTLWVRSDLLPALSVDRFPPSALHVDTKVFFFQRSYSREPGLPTQLMNRTEHAVANLVREAERQRASGFILVWCLPKNPLRWSAGSSYFDIFVSMAVRNPSQPRSRPGSRVRPKHFEANWARSDHESIDDTSVRLLLKMELGEGIQSYSSESEGTWDDLRARLEREDALIIRFEAFGDIGDRVCGWRIQERHALRPLVPDITVLPSWHPITWLPALEALIDSSEREAGDGNPPINQSSEK